MTELTTLDGLTTGRYVVTTANGTRHHIDLDKRTAVRTGAPGREWGGNETITPDGQPFHFTLLADATVGKQMQLDNAEEWRITSSVRSIEEMTDR